MRFSSILAISLSVIAVSASDSYGDEVDNAVASSTCTPTPTPEPSSSLEPAHSSAVDPEYQSSPAPGGYEKPTTTVPTSSALETPTGHDSMKDPEFASTTNPPDYPPPSSEKPYGSSSIPDSTHIKPEHVTSSPVPDCPCAHPKGDYTYTTVTETSCPGGCHVPPPYSSSLLPGSDTLPEQTPPPAVESTTGYPDYPGYPNATNSATPPAINDSGAVANKATLVGGAVAALVGVVSYLL